MDKSPYVLIKMNSDYSLLLSSTNREFLMYYDLERDTFSKIFNVPGIQ